MSTPILEAVFSHCHIEQPSLTKGRLFDKPLYFVLTIAGTILISEILFMMSLQFVQPVTSFQKALLDALILLFTVLPSFWFFIVMPHNQHIGQLRRAEAEKDRIIAELRKNLDEVKTLRGIVPICASCKMIRDDSGCWHQVEVYVSAHSEAMFSHGMCPDCADEFMQTID